MYHIHPNYHTVRLSFFKITGKPAEKYLPNKGIVFKGISAEDFLRGVFNDAYVMEGCI